MTNQQFIENCAAGKYNGKVKSHSSLWFDGEHIYSYGRHYPLLIRIGGAWLLNTAGYSVTTSKHIGLAGRYATYRLPIIGGETGAARLLLQAMERIDELTARLAGLSARAWRQKEDTAAAIEELTPLVAYLRALPPTIKEAV